MTELEALAVGESTARAFVRVPDGARAGVVVLHPWWGLNADVLAYANRLADAGFAVVAPDMFKGQVATDRDDAQRLADEGDAGGADAIALAAIDRLAALLGPGAPVAVLGFSFGAGYAIWAASERPGVVASVVYYGAYAGPFLARSKASLLGHFAEDDEFTSEDEIRELEAGYRTNGREVTIERYPGTGHWFAEPSRTDAYHEAAAELAFSRTAAFLGQVLGAGRT